MTAGLLRLRRYASLAEIDAEPAAQKAKVVSLAWRETRDDQMEGSREMDRSRLNGPPEPKATH
jgi:hypothetical protein